VGLSKDWPEGSEISQTSYGLLVRMPRDHECEAPSRWLWQEYDILPGDQFVCAECNEVLTAVSLAGELEWAKGEAQ